MSLSLIINNIDNSTAQWIKEESERRGIKMENLILELIQKGVKIECGQPQIGVYHDLDALSGTWNEDQTEEFMKAMSDFEKPDEKLWQ